MKLTKEIKEWLVMIIIVAVIFLGGWQTTIASSIQKVALATGFFSAEMVDSKKTADLDFTVSDLSGNMLNLKELDGNVVFLNFWASWCPPCLAELPSIEKLYKKQKGEVHFILISLDKNRAAAERYVQKNNLTVPVYFLESGLPSSFEASSIPTTYLINKTGSIVVEEHGMADYFSTSFQKIVSEVK